MKDWIKNIKPGDKLRPLALWNETSKPSRHLADKVKVLEVEKKSGCQSEIVFKVGFLHGGTVWLDAGWFEPPVGGE